MNQYKPEGLLIKTTRNYEYISSKAGLERALERQIILEAPVILCDHNFNLHIELCPGVRGIMPREEVEYSPEGGWTFVGKVMSLLFNTLSRLVITFLPRSKCLLISPSICVLFDFFLQFFIVTGLPSKRYPAFRFLSRADQEISVFRHVAPPTSLRLEFLLEYQGYTRGDGNRS